MSGMFGVVSEDDCVNDLFFGTDYQSHLGKKTGGIAVFDGKEIQFDIKDISMFPFRPQLDNFRGRVHGNKGIGVISDLEPQPLKLQSHLGKYAIAHVGRVSNIWGLVEGALEGGVHFSDMSGQGPNPTEVVGFVINQGNDFVDGIEIMQSGVEGSSSVMVLTGEGIYVGRDRFGRTPIHIGRRENAVAACTDNCSFKNLGFKLKSSLGPGEVGIITEKGYEQLKPGGNVLQECGFLLVYYGNPTASFFGKNTEVVRNNLGKFLARRDRDLVSRIDFASGIPDSGIGSGIGYACEGRIPFRRPMIKYTETWQRSFMPQDNSLRDLVARMKLIFIEDLIRGNGFIVTDDSLVRGTQSKAKMKVLFEGYGAREVHFRLSSPPLMFGCEFLNFSISESIYQLAARRAIRALEGRNFNDFSTYLDEGSLQYRRMVDWIREDVGCTSLKYQKLGEMVGAMGVKKEDVCTYCWDGCKGSC